MSEINSVIKSGISALREVVTFWATNKNDSLIEYTSATRVEPLVIIDAACEFSDALPETNQTLLSMFCGYYLQAFTFSVNVDKVNIGKHLDKLNPNRSVKDAITNSNWGLTTESFEDQLPIPGDVASMEAADDKDRAAAERAKMEAEKVKHMWAKFDFDTSQTYKREQREAGTADARNAQELEKMQLAWAKFRTDRGQAIYQNAVQAEEAIKRAQQVQQQFDLNKDKIGFDKAVTAAHLELEKLGMELRQREMEMKASASEVGIGRDTISTLSEKSNMAIGKMLTVEVSEGSHKATIPIAVRLMVNTIGSDSLVHILSAHGAELTSFKERWHMWRSGRLAFFKDLILCNDLIDKHRRNIMTDKDGLYTAISKNASKHKLAAVISGTPSVADASNMIVMSDKTLTKLNLAINGQMSDFRTRQKVFDQTSIMIIAVIETEWSRVTFYHRGISTPSEISLKEMKIANSGNGVDVGDVLKAYQLGNHPSL